MTGIDHEEEETMKGNREYAMAILSHFPKSLAQRARSHEGEFCLDGAYCDSETGVG